MRTVDIETTTTVSLTSVNNALFNYLRTAGIIQVENTLASVDARCVSVAPETSD